ncbi:MAG: Uma2 family endonuclease [Myxococcota bacterium]
MLEDMDRGTITSKEVFMESVKPELIVYPDSDGLPMADNTAQFGWIVFIKENLDAMLPDDFVAGDLLWYPVKGRNDIRMAPDVMVVIGRPKGYRGSYQQFNEDDIAPKVVFEIFSPNNTHTEMKEKHKFYEEYGALEYYIYYPVDESRSIDGLDGWARTDPSRPLKPVPDMRNWKSPALGIIFDISGAELNIIRPDGQHFLSHKELEQRSIQAEEKAQEAETKAQEAEAKAQEAEEKAREAEAKAREAEEKAREAEEKAREAEEKAREAEAKATAEHAARLHAEEQAQQERDARDALMKRIQELEQRLSAGE